MNRERSFYADTERKSSYGEGFADAAVSFCDYDAFEDLNSGLVAFDNFKGYFYGIANVKRRSFGFEIFLIDLINDVHDDLYLLYY